MTKLTDLVQAKKRAEILEQQTRPAREVVGGKVGAAASVVGKVLSQVAEQPAVQAVGRATMSAINKTIEAQDKLDKTTQEWERQLRESQAAKKVREKESARASERENSCTSFCCLLGAGSAGGRSARQGSRGRRCKRHHNVRCQHLSGDRMGAQSAQA